MKDQILELIEKTYSNNPYDPCFSNGEEGWNDPCDHIKSKVKDFAPWISVKDRLPERDTWWLASDSYGDVDKVRHYGDGKFIDHDGSDFFAVFYMPLPSPPTKEQQ